MDERGSTQESRMRTIVDKRVGPDGRGILEKKNIIEFRKGREKAC